MAHPIVEQMTPSDEQRPAIEARGCNVVVTAGAGAGKTRTLVARYLSLLAEGLPLRSIIAITFTKKAAREMRNRVRDEVRRYIDGPDLEQIERVSWQNIFSALDAARIDTVHGLCAEIIHAHPAEAGVDPRFEVLDEAQAALLRREAVDETMSWIADDESAVLLFNVLREYALGSTLDALLQKRLDAQQAFIVLPDDISTYWRQILHTAQQQQLDALFDAPDWQAAVETLRENVAKSPDDLMELQRRGVLSAIEQASGDVAKRIETLSALANINLRGGSAKPWPDGKDQLADVKAALTNLRDMWKSLPEFVIDGWTALDEQHAQAVAQMRRAFDFALGRYTTLKRERDALDFDDLEAGALRLIQDHVSVLNHWRREARAILVDEYQDTNARQRDLVNLLNGNEHKLFIVGDAKQSIYRFRNADVTVFRSERDRIAVEGGQAVPLATSYRAHRDLVVGLNDLLKPILGEQADPHRPYVEPFAALEHHRREAGNGFVAPHIEVHLTVGSKSDGALERAAKALCVQIASLVHGSAQVAERDHSRPLRYDDIVILCRASTSFGAYENAFEEAGIPFLTVAGRGFFDRPEVRDVLNALQALADPTDDLALVGLLRSPALGWSDAALYRLSEQRAQLEDATSLWDTLHVMVEQLADEAASQVAHAINVVEVLHLQAGRTSVADLLKSFLDMTDYRAALIRAGQSRAARNVGKLLEAAHSSIVSVGEFLEYVKGLRDSGAREAEAPATSEGAVRIMSVHAAKGLEFPVVAIGDINYGAPGRNSLLIDPELGVLLPMQDEDTHSSIYLLGKHRNDDQEQAESDRLVYVAATRAREKLIISGSVGLSKKGQLSRLGGWLGRIVESHGLNDDQEAIEYDEEGDNIIRLDWQVGATPVTCCLYEPKVEFSIEQPESVPVTRAVVDIPPILLAPIAATHDRIDRRTSERERATTRTVWRVVPPVDHSRAPAWVIGSLVHGALAVWRFPNDDFDRWAEARARSYGITDMQQIADAVMQSRRLLMRFQNCPLYQEMQDAEQRLHEVPYSISADGRAENGIIDVLFSRNGTWSIVEFKTDSIRDQTALARLLEEKDYLQQAERYMKATEQLLGQRPRSMLCLLDYAGVVHIEDVSKG